jgi:hypothetical protein
VALIVKNTGWLPSYVTKRALERKYVRPVIAELALPHSASLISGKERMELTQLEGFCYKSPANSGYAADTTEDRVKAEWTIKAAKGTKLSLTARHDRAGVVRTEIEL